MSETERNPEFVSIGELQCGTSVKLEGPEREEYDEEGYRGKVGTNSWVVLHSNSELSFEVHRVLEVNGEEAIEIGPGTHSGRDIIAIGERWSKDRLRTAFRRGVGFWLGPDATDEKITRHMEGFDKQLELYYPQSPVRVGYIRSRHTF